MKTNSRRIVKHLAITIAAGGILLSYSACSRGTAEEKIRAMYSVGGTVTKSDGGVAAGATAELRYMADDSPAGQTTVDATGTYAITGVPAGTYIVRVALNGYETGMISGIEVTDADISGRNVVLQKIAAPTYSVSGTVMKSDGSAAAGATVQVKRAADHTNAGQASIADAAGRYTALGIPSGVYNILISLNGYETGILTGVIVTDADVTLQNVTLNTATAPANAIHIAYSGNDVTIDNLPPDGSIVAAKDGADVTLSASTPEAVEYVVSGSSSNGSLTIRNNATAPGIVRLTLNNAVITSASKLPPLRITENEGVTVISLTGTNILSDHAANEENAALISKNGSLEFEGYGSLYVSGAAKHAIAAGKKSVSIRSGNITVTAAASDGIHAESGIDISGGSLDITASGDGLDAGAGMAMISGGNLRMVSPKDDTKGIKADAGVTISGGFIEMNVSGAQAKGIGSKADITVSGGEIAIITSGAAVLEAAGSGYDPSYCTAIKSDADVVVTGGTIRIESRATSDGGKGISADGNIRILGGTLDIAVAGDGRVYTSSTGATDSYTAACLKSNRDILLAGGHVTCSSSGTGGKGVNADGSITIGNTGADNTDLALTVTTSGERFLVSGNAGGGRPGGGFPGGSGGDYANPKGVKSEGDLIIHSGTIVVNGTQQSAGGEGMESKGAFIINGGVINIYSYDDCINGGTSVTINGGTVFVAARGQDAIDSNGSLTINGGLTIANGVRGDGEAFDGQPGRYTINGGIIVGTSGSLMETPAGPQPAVIYSRATAGSDIGIRNVTGDDILLFRVPVISGASIGTSLIVTFSDPRLTAGTYTLSYNGKIEGGTSFNGYITGGSYSGGSSKSFVIGNSAYAHVQ